MQGSWILVSLNSRLKNNKEEGEPKPGRAKQVAGGRGADQQCGGAPCPRAMAPCLSPKDGYPDRQMERGTPCTLHLSHLHTYTLIHSYTHPPTHPHTHTLTRVLAPWRPVSLQEMVTETVRWNAVNHVSCFYTLKHTSCFYTFIDTYSHETCQFFLHLSWFILSRTWFTWFRTHPTCYDLHPEPWTSHPAHPTHHHTHSPQPAPYTIKQKLCRGALLIRNTPPPRTLS